jgi:Na+/glutamate symporter
MDMAGIITAVATVCLVLGAFIGFIVSVLSRLSSLEQSREDDKDNDKEIKQSIRAIHERLDAYFIRSGPRAPKE